MKSIDGLYIPALFFVLFLGCSKPTAHVARSSKQVQPPPQKADKAWEEGADPFSNIWEFQCLNGQRIVPFNELSTKAIVLIFIATDCPIANAYHPYLKQIQKDYQAQGILFFLVHSNSDIREVVAQEHAQQYALDIPIVLDPEQSIAKRAKAEVTPEAVVFTRRSLKAEYRGAINNLYAGYGKKRPVATEHYLTDALKEIVADRPVTRTKAKPIGCFISFDQQQ